VATQVLLGNVISVVGFVYVLAKFFEARIIGKSPIASRFPAPPTAMWLIERCLLLAFDLICGMIDEERHLVRFFGQDYVDFRSKVGTWLPAGLVSREAR
jgi:protein-S-isoprenylcysteine O-methyltransferase